MSPLQRGSRVVLVDWPSEDVPRALLAAGCEVMSINALRGTASGYSVAESGELAITPLEAMPESADVVCLYRPQPEHRAIAERAAALGAPTLWVQSGRLSDDARPVAEAAGMAVVEDVSIAEAARALGG